MNLYKLHSTPESLNFYETVSDNNPDIFWEKYKDSKELKTREVASIFMLQINGGNHK